MNTKRLNFKSLISLIAISSVLFSCNDDSDSTPSAKTDYDFANVDYSGQTARIMMLDSLESYIKSGNDGVTKLSAVDMNAIYTNESGDLFGSSKDLESKTANDPTLLANVYTQIPFYFASAEAASGNMDNIIGGRLFDANGHEPAQMVGKGLMGAVLYFQSVSYYLTPEKLEGADNETVTEGKGTDMEHYWDEGFGYFGATTDYLSNEEATKYYWAKYAASRADVYDVRGDIFNAFIAGRQAISDKDYETRDAQAIIIQNKWEELVAINVVHYANSVISDTELGDILHHWSEAVAFATALQYNTSKVITNEEIAGVLGSLYVEDIKNANKEALNAQMEAAKAIIKNTYGFSDEVMSNL
ncbi:DUF4856 domain-containing protein [Flammeovirga pacifica]|uniref:DUF4856 domain-containing protein n=1 Tax=Flammeovirga pacifica TaxID=915059 RepID=A0A1S1YXM0_FLAPC|nr:DUF4856 domain-containing protein [Flammeovirga pacifica]OHX65748.1 hypothetical protein NH26_04980 [Flammeovirga pacifica]